MKQVNSQTRSPEASRAEQTLDRENYHYVKVQKDGKEWDGQLEEYLDKVSPTDPAKPKYEIASEDRSLTGSSKMALLRCSVADHEADMADAKRQGLAAVAESADGEETSRGGSTISLD